MSITMDIYQGRDLRDVPAYTVPAVARLSGVTRATLRNWVGHPTSDAVILRPDPDSPLLSFINVIEVYVLAAIRRTHGVLLQRVRPAVTYMRQQYQQKHPLAEEAFLTDGMNLFIRRLEGAINVTRKGQILFEFMEARFKRVDWDADGLAHRLFPLVRRRDDLEPSEIEKQPKIVMVDARISFGQPSLQGSGIPTAVIAGRFHAGDSVNEIAIDLNRDSSEIEEALRFESIAA